MSKNYKILQEISLKLTSIERLTKHWKEIWNMKKFKIECSILTQNLPISVLTQNLPISVKRDSISIHIFQSEKIVYVEKIKNAKLALLKVGSCSIWWSVLLTDDCKR